MKESYPASAMIEESPDIPSTDTGSRHHNILIVGGGTAGITTAARLARGIRNPDIAIIEPADKHYYQPLWTLVGGGVMEKEVTERPMAEVIPKHTMWLKTAVEFFYPDQNKLTTKDGQVLSYDFLVVCPGIQVDYNRVKGLPETLGKNGVCCNYSYEHVDYTWEMLRNLRGGKALFTQPVAPVKCGGAPQKIMYLAADYLRKNGLLDETEVHFFSPGKVIFGIEKFAKTLRGVVHRYGIHQNYQHNLIEVRGPEHEAVFEVTDDEGNTELRTVSYDMIHVTPPMSAPDFIKNSALADADGWLDVDPHSLQHRRYPNVFALGDVAGTPNAKTGAAVRKQAPVVAHNLIDFRRNGTIKKPASYDGYSSCPLVTGYGKLVLAEFDYDNNPAPSFPFDTSKERYSMYLLKKNGLPWMYWNLMLKGKA